MHVKTLNYSPFKCKVANCTENWLGNTVHWCLLPTELFKVYNNDLECDGDKQINNPQNPWSGCRHCAIQTELNYRGYLSDNSIIIDNCNWHHVWWQKSGADCVRSWRCVSERCITVRLNIACVWVRRCSHYGGNDGDGDGDVTFCRSHFTFRTVAITVSLPCRERRCDNGCHGDGDGDGRGRCYFACVRAKKRTMASKGKKPRAK